MQERKKKLYSIAAARPLAASAAAAAAATRDRISRHRSAASSGVIPASRSVCSGGSFFPFAFLCIALVGGGVLPVNGAAEAADRKRPSCSSAAVAPSLLPLLSLLAVGSPPRAHGHPRPLRQRPARPQNPGRVAAEDRQQPWRGDDATRGALKKKKAEVEVGKRTEGNRAS